MIDELTLGLAPVIVEQLIPVIGELRDAGVDGPYLWLSPAGQVVDDLPGR